MHIRFGIYLREDGPKIGRGKVRLLIAVRDHGSISAAARSMAMSYRHAWNLLDELNRCFDEPVFVASMGGARGGGAQLTRWGEELVDRFEDMERAVETALADHVVALETRARRTSTGKRDRRTG